jgi:hypothetical protein
MEFQTLEKKESNLLFQSVEQFHDNPIKGHLHVPAKIHGTCTHSSV